MKVLKVKVAALAVCWLLLAGCGVELLARGRQGTFYNPNIYSRTRQTMSNRAAVRAALRKKRLKNKKKAVRARRAARRANVR